MSCSLGWWWWSVAGGGVFRKEKLKRTLYYVHFYTCRYIWWDNCIYLHLKTPNVVDPALYILPVLIVALSYIYLYNTPFKAIVRIITSVVEQVSPDYNMIVCIYIRHRSCVIISLPTRRARTLQVYMQSWRVNLVAGVSRKCMQGKMFSYFFLFSPLKKTTRIAVEKKTERTRSRYTYYTYIYVYCIYGVYII